MFQARSMSYDPIGKIHSSTECSDTFPFSRWERGNLLLSDVGLTTIGSQEVAKIKLANIKPLKGNVKVSLCLRNNVSFWTNIPIFQIFLLTRENLASPF